MFQTPAKDILPSAAVPWTAAPPTNLNDSFQEDVEKTDTKVELFGGYRERDLNNDDDDGPPLRSFTFSGSQQSFRARIDPRGKDFPGCQTSTQLSSAFQKPTMIKSALLNRS